MPGENSIDFLLTPCETKYTGVLFAMATVAVFEKALLVMTLETDLTSGLMNREEDDEATSLSVSENSGDDGWRLAARRRIPREVVYSNATSMFAVVQVCCCLLPAVEDGVI